MTHLLQDVVRSKFMFPVSAALPACGYCRPPSPPTHPSTRPSTTPLLFVCRPLAAAAAVDALLCGNSPPPFFEPPLGAPALPSSPPPVSSCCSPRSPPPARGTRQKCAKRWLGVRRFTAFRQAALLAIVSVQKMWRGKQGRRRAALFKLASNAAWKWANLDRAQFLHLLPSRVYGLQRAGVAERPNIDVVRGKVWPRLRL
jgi:hypothetical protein